MKKSVFFLLPLMFLMACKTYQITTVDRLEMGMSKAAVRHTFGLPRRILSASQTEGGLLEVLEYKMDNSDVYSLDFMNDRLIGYHFLFADIEYIPLVPAPIVDVYPVYPLPIESPIVKPKPPVDRPRPRPVHSGEKPDHVISGRPGSSVRPTNPAPTRPATSRPESGNNGRVERPRGSDQPSRESTRPQNQGSDSNNSTSSKPSRNNSSTRDRN